MIRVGLYCLFPTRIGTLTNCMQKRRAARSHRMLLLAPMPHNPENPTFMIHATSAMLLSKKHKSLDHTCVLIAFKHEILLSVFFCMTRESGQVLPTSTCKRSQYNNTYKTKGHHALN